VELGLYTVLCGTQVACGTFGRKCHPFGRGQRKLLKHTIVLLACVQVTSGKCDILYIGITCGLSAPYVAGQLDHCMQHLDRFLPVLIGFNPVDAARWVIILTLAAIRSYDAFVSEINERELGVIFAIKRFK